MSNFDNVRLPEDIEVGAQGGPTFMTDVVSVSSGGEQRNQTWDQQRIQWDISYGIQSAADAMVVKDFFYARRGRAIGFWFRDWSDYVLDDEVIASGDDVDGVRKIFHLTRTYGGAFPFVRYITQPDWDTITVEVNGTPTAAWTSGDNGVVIFTVAPALHASITVSGEFNVPVRFNTDAFRETIEAFATGTISSLSVVEIRQNPNNPPVSVDLNNAVTTLPEDHNTTAHTFVADVFVNDDGLGANTISLSGADLAHFEYDPTTAKLYLKAGTVLDFETKSTYHLTIGASDVFLRNSLGVSTTYTLTLTDVNEAPVVTTPNLANALALNADTSSHVKICDIVVADPDAVLGTNALTLSGTDAASFSLVGTITGHSYSSALYLNAGVDTSVAGHLSVNIVSTDGGLVVTTPVLVTIGVVPGTTTYDTAGTFTLTVAQYTTLKIDVYGAGAAAWGFSPGGPSAPSAPATTYVQNDQTVTALNRWHLEPTTPTANPNAYVPGVTALTAKQSSFGLGAALMAGTAGQPGALGASPATGLYPGRGYTSGKGGDRTLLNGTVIPGGPAHSVAAPNVAHGGEVETATVAGTAGGVPGAGGGGGVFQQTTGVPDRSGVTAGIFSVLAEKDTLDAYMAGAGAGFFASHTWTYTDAQTGTGADYKAKAPQVGDILTIKVGAGGVGGAGTVAGGNGGHGRVVVTIA